MSLKDILVVVDETPSAAVRIDAAVALAVAHDAHLTGLHVTPPFVLPAFVETQLTDEIRVSQRESENELRRKAEALFLERVRLAGRLECSEWRSAWGDPTDAVALHGRYSDLIVIGQLDPEFDYESPVVRPQDLIFECGRPVLVVPYAGRFDTVGQRVLVGWSASREAARAVADAVPVLEKARKVTLLAINPSSGSHGLGDEPGADIARHLAHHKIRAEAAHFRCAPGEVGDSLLNHVTDLSCDLVVMGAYGQSRLRTMVLGSLTGFILEHMTVPVLMSH
jgi:nucleotide-binding universal stress UspA family protein